MLQRLVKYSLVYFSLLLLLSACGSGGEESSSNINSSSNLKNPSIELNSDISTVEYGGNVTLSWVTQEVHSCVASGDWSGAKGINGSEVINSLTATGSFSLTCTAENGLMTETQSVTVMPLSTVTPSATSPVNYVWGTLTGSADVYIDRTYTYTTLPAAYAGYQVLKTANDDKNSTGGSFISFDIDQAATIYVAYTEGGNLPVWLSSWTPTGDSLSTTDRTLAVYSQNFTAGTVTLGGNESASSMYTVFLASSTGGSSSPPSINLSASPSSVAFNGSTTISWNASDASSCSASGDWSGNKATSGAETISNLIADASFTLTCTGAGGSSSDTDSITVFAPSVPSVNITASPANVASGGSTTITWDSSDASSCSASGDWSGTKPTSGSQMVNNLTADANFTLTCTGAGGSSSDSDSVTVSAPGVPTVNITASPSGVAYDGSTTITWNSSDASSCSASGDWSGTKPTSGSQSISNLIADASFTLTCTGAGGSSSDSDSVTVSAPSVPTVNITASPSNVEYDGTTTITWASSDASSCSASGGWSGNKSVSGSQTISNLIADSSFTLTCTGAGGSSSDSDSVTVSAPSVPTVNLSASPSSVAYDGSTTITWNSSDASSCNASGDWSGNKSTNGSETINSLLVDSQFILNCSGAGGTASDTVNVAVVLNNNGTALLSWTPPTENTDGSNLNDLAGYKIYYGTSPGSYTDTVTINDAGVTSYLVENLASANWYFVMTSFNDTNIESAYSAEVSKSIN